MADVAVVTDSTADLPPALAAENGISVVPLSVAVGGETFPDGVLTQQEFFDRMNAAPTLPTTSQPPVGAFEAAYEAALQSAAHVVSVHISERLSGTICSAREAAKRFGERVQVVDSLNLSWGLGWQVLEASRAAAAGLSVSEVVSRVEAVRDKAELIVGVDKLDNLAKGGRIGRVSAFLGTMLNLKVVFHVAHDGTFEPLYRVRGSQSALEQTVEWIAKQMAGRTKGAFCVLHALAEDKAAWLRSEIEKRFDVAEYHEVPTGIVIATHTGTGWGVAFVPLD